MRLSPTGNLGANINKILTGSSRSLIEQAIYPKTTAGNRTLGPLGFGAFYSAGTYIGFPKNFTGSNSRTYKPKRLRFTESKPMYGNSYGRKKFSFNRTRWFNTRVWNRKYRKSVYIHRGRRY